MALALTAISSTFVIGFILLFLPDHSSHLPKREKERKREEREGKRFKKERERIRKGKEEPLLSSSEKREKERRKERGEKERGKEEAPKIKSKLPSSHVAPSCKSISSRNFFFSCAVPDNWGRFLF